MRNSGETPRKLDLTPKFLGEPVSAHFKYARTIWENIANNKIAAFTIPLGVMVQLFCAKAAR